MMSTPGGGSSACLDLSKVHELLGALFAPVKDPEGWRQFRLSQDQVDQFWQDGFLTNIQVLSHQQCDTILADYQRLVDENHSFPGIGLMYEFHSNQSKDPSNVLLHCLGHWRLTPSFHDVCFLPAIAVPASQLLDSKQEKKVRLWHDQLFAKPPLHGGNVAWWTRHGGPLPVTDFNFKDMESIQTILTDEEKANFKPVHANLKKGEASIHHPLTVHGSWSNRSEFSRRACVVNFIADGVCSNTDEPLLQGTTKFKKGDKMEGQFHPLVFDPAWSRT